MEFIVLIGSAIFLAGMHTILGPDHYVPFIAIAREKEWSMTKMLIVTSLCGMGHVIGTALLGLAVVILGVAVFDIESIQNARGSLAAWLLMVFGVVYALWGIWRIIKKKKHQHEHVHADGTAHSHTHGHLGGHAHVHSHAQNRSITWILFLIFIFGPCEALIPLMLYPAAQGEYWLMTWIVLAFALSTVVTMLTMVVIGWYGTSKISRVRLGAYTPVVAGTIVFLCGYAIQYLGL